MGSQVPTGSARVLSGVEDTCGQVTTTDVLQFDRFHRREPDVHLPVFDGQFVECSLHRRRHVATFGRPAYGRCCGFILKDDCGVEVGSAFDIGEIRSSRSLA